MKYFPFFRGKRNELLALRDLAANIARSGNVIPILELVRSNSTTSISIDRFIEESMPFLLICNPVYGDFSHDHGQLSDEIINQELSDYDNWIPTLHVDEATTLQAFEAFADTYDQHPIALVYYGKPQRSVVCSYIEATNVAHHIFINGRVEHNYIKSIPIQNRVIVVDPFYRRRNVDYPDLEFFTDLNTVKGNQEDVNFGDFSIVGDHYTDTGGRPYTVALHHIHFDENSHALNISRFKSDRTDGPDDPQGKTIEATNHLVDALDNLSPNNTSACDMYRTISKNETFRGLGYMKRLAIKHHLEVILSDGGLGA